MVLTFPIDGLDEMACHTLGGDGLLDLTLKFRSSELVAALEADLGRPLEARETLKIGLSAELAGTASSGGCGAGLYGEDVVRILRNKGGKRAR